MAIGGDSKATGKISYQSGIAVGPAVDASALSGLLKPSTAGDARQQQFAQMTAANDRANLNLQAQQTNAQHWANAQARRSEASISGLNDRAKLYGDYNDRANQQTDLAAQVAATNIGFSSGVTAANIRRWMNIARGNA
jgi:hypothetical protein